MKLAHQIWIKIFSYEKFNEDENLIRDNFLKLFPFNFEDEKLELTQTEAKGFSELKITIFEIILKKDKHIKKFLEKLLQNLDEEQKKKILEQSGKRLDENLDFFLRFDKEQYMKNNILKLTESGNCIHFKFSIAAFPKKRDIALKIIKSLFDEKINY